MYADYGKLGKPSLQESEITSGSAFDKLHVLANLEVLVIQNNGHLCFWTTFSSLSLRLWLQIFWKLNLATAQVRQCLSEPYHRFFCCHNFCHVKFRPKSSDCHAKSQILVFLVKNMVILCVKSVVLSDFPQTMFAFHRINRVPVRVGTTAKSAVSEVTAEDL